MRIRLVGNTHTASVNFALLLTTPKVVITALDKLFTTHFDVTNDKDENRILQNFNLAKREVDEFWGKLKRDKEAMQPYVDAGLDEFLDDLELALDMTIKGVRGNKDTLYLKFQAWWDKAATIIIAKREYNLNFRNVRVANMNKTAFNFEQSEALHRAYDPNYVKEDTPPVVCAACKCSSDEEAVIEVPQDKIAQAPTPEELAKEFHDTYEAKAHEFDYETRKDSAVPWEEVPANNKQLMISVAAHIMDWLQHPEIKPDEIYLPESEDHNASLSKTSYIKKIQDGKWGVYSSKGDLLGTHPTKEKAKAQLGAIHANQHKAASGSTGNKTLDRILKFDGEKDTADFVDTDVNEFSKEDRQAYDALDDLTQSEVDHKMAEMTDWYWKNYEYYERLHEDYMTDDGDYDDVHTSKRIRLV